MNFFIELLNHQIDKYVKDKQILKNPELTKLLDSIKGVYTQFDSELESIKEFINPISKDLITKNQNLEKNITEKNVIHFELHKSLAILKALLDSINDGIVSVNSENEIVSFNYIFQRMWNLSDEELIGQNFNDVISKLSSKSQFSNEFAKTIISISNKKEQTYHNYFKVNSYEIYEVHSQPQYVDDIVTGRLWSFRDISEIIDTKQKLLDSYYKDHLTGLYNRTYFLEKLESLGSSSQIGPGNLYSVLHINIDRFKQINDEFDHEVADQLLIKTGRRLKKVIKKNGTIARLGGDEFIILLEEPYKEDNVISLTEEILKKFQFAFYVHHRHIYLSISIGIAFSSVGYTNILDLIRYADLALENAKKMGGNHYSIFDFNMFEIEFEKVQLEAEIRKAIKEDLFQLYFQPIVKSNTYTVVGFEALIRWKHPLKGWIPPDKFIPLAEETGLIIPIGEFVIRKAVRFLQELISMGYKHYISLNLSLGQLKQKNLYRVVESVVKTNKIFPELLCFEITESSIMDNSNESISLLTKFKNLGIKLSIDDFGTGYSSLSYLKQIPMNYIKIDRSFVSGLPNNKKDYEIIKAIVNISHALNIRVIAEGIETQEQLSIIDNIGCDYIQGYFFGKPIPMDSVVQFLIEYNIASN